MKSRLYLDTYTMPSAGIGPESPLPAFHPAIAGNAVNKFSKNISNDDRKYINGNSNRILPYGLLDSFDRSRKPRSFKTVVLENDMLRAVFLLELGGRLWSLYYKPLGRELLYSNPVFQPVNFGVRNAWFSGGIEWNFSIKGHGPFCCSNIFAARVIDDDGNHILRLYEYERVHKIAFQIDISLCDAQPFLFVRVRIVNPHEYEIPMYWWTNAAIPESDGRRTIVPTDSAFYFDYDEMTRIPMPICEDRDISYPTNVSIASDFFYRIAEGQRCWMASIDAEGTGIIETSTPHLKGRKMFTWGVNRGSQNWQDFLSEKGQKYIELQAGLARTQAECIPMPAKAEWAWLEAWGPIQADPKLVHSNNWASACEEVQTRLDSMLTEERLKEELRRGKNWENKKPAEILHKGSGWGALEKRRRMIFKEPPFSSEALEFPEDSIGQDQEPWLKLLEDGILPCKDAKEPHKSWMVGKEWQKLLEDSVKISKGEHWLSWYHLGVMYYSSNEVDKAEQAWQHSLYCCSSSWTYRNLAVLAKTKGKLSEAADLYLAACRKKGNVIQLLVECGECLVEAGRPAAFIDMFQRLDDKMKSVASLQVTKMKALIAIGELDEVENILTNNFVLPDIREGETVLSDLWFSLHEKRITTSLEIDISCDIKSYVRKKFPLPFHIDYTIRR